MLIRHFCWFNLLCSWWDIPMIHALMRITSSERRHWYSKALAWKFTRASEIPLQRETHFPYKLFLQITVATHDEPNLCYQTARTVIIEIEFSDSLFPCHSQIRWCCQYVVHLWARNSTRVCRQFICLITAQSIMYSSLQQCEFILWLILVSSNASVASSTISSIDLLGEDLTNQRFGRLYRRWLKCANRTMKQNLRQVRRKPHWTCLHNRIRSIHCSLVGDIVDVSVSHLLLHFLRMIRRNTSTRWFTFARFIFLVFSIRRHFEEFFCTHAPLIENHFQKIMNAAETNINERNSIAAALLDVGKNMHSATSLVFSLQKLFTFKDELYTLYTRARLQFPAWYILTQEHLAMSKRRALAQQLCSIIDLFTTPKYGE